jgi:uncharacterized protein (DUF2235 family)
MPATAAHTWVSRRLTMWAGLIAGYGVLDNVADAYSFIVDRYAPGDQIYLVGFSRGALTVRLVAGLLHRIGVLRPDAKSLIPYALELYGWSRVRTPPPCDSAWPAALGSGVMEMQKAAVTY